MSSIKEHLEIMELQIQRIKQDGHVTEPDEFVVTTGIEMAINEARKVFERTKNMAKANND